jgi:hypothetical protein
MTLKIVNQKEYVLAMLCVHEEDRRVVCGLGSLVKGNRLSKGSESANDRGLRNDSSVVGDTEWVALCELRLESE